jgi:hypothetical protein
MVFSADRDFPEKSATFWLRPSSAFHGLFEGKLAGSRSAKSCQLSGSSFDGFFGIPGFRLRHPRDPRKSRQLPGGPFMVFLAPGIRILALYKVANFSGMRADPIRIVPESCRHFGPAFPDV